ncbi:pantoate--beta-alanine ligase [Arenibacter sp. 6A1]|uniref:pantoate--beta-alanine ligase n=1 Tax=Arenibacter sp. 6A1 TaxID=2720391 RepID=UPI0014465301|nr:pantoate--beta-alanine ligase [Arenibacter sp. 6A1]NKI26445.1 pantoate--beta-alanine ligase [Arenibacter sp. 6A1]
MQLFTTKKDLDSFLYPLRKGKSIGLVPTMGALHTGHLSLVKKSVAENHITVISIFVNPTQFNNQDDLEKYPKTLDADISLLSSVSDDLVVFAPSVSEIYAEEVASKTYDFEGLEKVMEGEFRQGHFEGVGTIVEKLFRLTMPNKAYFGEKDFQQLQIIKKLVKITQLPIQIIGCPILREPNGLAMSSRNERLTPNQRNTASFIYSTLQEAKHKFGTKSAVSITDWVKEEFENHESLQLEYFKITDENNLQPVLEKENNTAYRAFIAVYAGDVRLIDNILL